MQQSTKYLQFFKISQKLKFVKRTGWTYFPQIQDVESVADHSWMISLLALSLPKIDNFNRDLCLKIALLHDLAEVIVGDITPSDNVPKDKKKQLEDEAFATMVQELDQEIKEELTFLQRQYEEGVSLEAKVARDLDKYEMMLMAYQYEMKYHVNLKEFFDESVIKTPIMQQLLNDLMKERQQFWNKM